MRPRAHVAILVAVAAAVTIALWATRGWTLVGVPHFDPELEPFSDAFVVLWGPEQCVAGKGEWLGPVCFVPSVAAEAHAQSYEPWFAFQRLGLASAHVLPVAAAMIGLFYLAIGMTLRPATLGQALLGLVLLATPAVQLAVERANFDLLIVALVCLAARMLATGRPNDAVVGCLVLAVATMLKLYTGLAGALAWLIPRPRQWTIFFAAAGASALALGVPAPETIVALNRGVPEGATRFSIGAHWLFRHRGDAAAWTTIAAALAACGIALARLRAVAAPRFERWPRRTAAFAVAFFVAVPIYFLKDSYDYRLVLWLPCLALPFAWLRGDVDARWRRLAMATLVLYLVVAGTELPCALLDRFASTGTAGWAGAAVGALIYAKQAATWLLVAALSVIFGYWLAGSLRGAAR
jgi:hypothetical protein